MVEHKCPYCGKNFIKSCNKTRHVREVHEKEKRKKTETIIDKPIIIEKPKIHNVQNAPNTKTIKLKSNNTCNKCQKSFRNKWFLTRHERLAHRIKTKRKRHRFECDNCSSVFTTKQLLVLHHKRKHDPNQRKIQWFVDSSDSESEVMILKVMTPKE